MTQQGNPYSITLGLRPNMFTNITIVDIMLQT